MTIRRPHSKSRNGCSMCKRRRVKCDEAKPVCTGCRRFSFVCDYATSQSSSPISPTGSKRVGRPRKEWDVSPMQTDLPSITDVAMSSDQNNLEPSNSELNINDLELLHYYTTTTYETFADPETPSIGHMYRVNIPRLGLANPFVLHLLLALAGRHLQFLTKDEPQATRYANMAEKHFSIALPQVTSQLSSLDTNNCQALYISSILICFYIFARRPEPGEYLVFSENATPLWLPLLRGVRCIMETIGPTHVFSGFLAPMTGEGLPQKAKVCTALKHSLPRLQWEEPFRKFRVFIESSADPNDVERYLAGLDGLAESFKATYGTDDNGAYNGEAANQVIFRWLYVLGDDLIQWMQQKRPLALIILAYFALLLKAPNMKDLWLLDGWSDHILIAIHSYTEERNRIWLQWPMEKAGLNSSSPRAL